MMVFWWSGRGYLVPVTAMLALCLLGFCLQAIYPAALDTPMFWGAGFVLTGPIVWALGTKYNRRKGFLPPAGLRERLTYRARNRFMSLPMEIWAIPFILGGTAAILLGMPGNR